MQTNLNLSWVNSFLLTWKNDMGRKILHKIISLSHMILNWQWVWIISLQFFSWIYLNFLLAFKLTLEIILCHIRICNGGCISEQMKNCTKMEFFIKGFFSKYDQICRNLRIWSPLLKKSLMENYIFCAVEVDNYAFFVFTVLLCNKIYKAFYVS